MAVLRHVRAALRDAVTWGRRRAGKGGNVGTMFALCAVAIVTGVGAGMDLSRAYGTQQKLSEIAALACQYASRPSVINTDASSYSTTGSAATYVSKVTSFLTSTWAREGISYSQTTAIPFAATANGPANVTMSASVPTTFMQIVGIKTVPVAASMHCYDTPATIAQVVADGTSPYLAQESFEATPCGSQARVCYVYPNGSTFAANPNPNAAAPSSTFPASPTYIGSGGTKWYVTGYCVETDSLSQGVNYAIPDGKQAAELDCDNGSDSAGNSAISTSVYLEAGNYELRWFYRGRVDYPHYDPAYICGSSINDTSWANDTTTGPGWSSTAVGATASRTNQINVYLDKETGTNSPPLHTTLDGPQQLAGGNLIDTCVYSPVWIERSVRIKVTTPSFYWLSFAADGASDSFGGQIDNIRLCQGTCSGTVQDNFPSPGTNPYYPGGTFNTATSTLLPDWSNMLLFRETFESPSNITATTSDHTATTSNLNSSYGTSGTASGWPSLPASGWATDPKNETIYLVAGSSTGQGSQSAWISTDDGGHSRLIGRPFLLVPGFYNFAYDYVSEAIFTTPSGLASTYCGATPAAANISALSGSGSGYAAIQHSMAMSGAVNTNTLAAFIANAQLVSTPYSTGVGQDGVSSYNNPDATLADTPPTTTNTATPTVAPDAISLTGYTPSTTSALLDICGYSPAWTARSVNFQINRTGMYWLDFSTQMAGISTIGGGAIDDVRITALGSLAMTGAPFSPVVVPVPAPQPSATLAFTGFSIVADPLTFPAPMQ